MFLVFFSRYVRFSIAGILFVVRYLWGVCMCRDTSRSRLSHRLACLRSHVLRAYCNFESKQVIDFSRLYAKHIHEEPHMKLCSSPFIKLLAFYKVVPAISAKFHLCRLITSYLACMCKAHSRRTPYERLSATTSNVRSIYRFIVSLPGCIE